MSPSERQKTFPLGGVLRRIELQSQIARSWESGRRVVQNPLSRPIQNNRWATGRIACMSARSPVFPFTWRAFQLPSAEQLNPWSPPVGWIKGQSQFQPAASPHASCPCSLSPSPLGDDEYE